ncbi:hypothetical protein PVL29_018330 [Vitis rotundifolia]|uniref:Uncharacterized protein n=1 Tax=Vitis rotundifolia TaxID=103349 RepID=A0AA39DG30_VITRO|nr:hypothetical protein PVL29_018330 [Vitis rotundifolia]
MVTNSSSSTQSLCNNNQSSVLLEFKQSFLIGQHAFDDASAYPKLQVCDKDTGHMIGLNLGSSCLYGSINVSSVFFCGTCIFKGLISSMIISITLRSILELCSSQISWELLALSKLVVLDLSQNPLKCQ